MCLREKMKLDAGEQDKMFKTVTERLKSCNSDM